MNQFFTLLKEAYACIKNEPPKMKLYYCPIFPDSKIVLNFCLSNSIFLKNLRNDDEKTISRLSRTKSIICTETLKTSRF